MLIIEGYLNQSTTEGGFIGPRLKQRGVKKLSLLAETWEDGIPLMPIRQPQTPT